MWRDVCWRTNFNVERNRNLMGAQPPAADALIHGLSLFVKSYMAYANGRLQETDDELRQDLRRRLTMVRNHVANIERRAVQRNDAGMVRELQSILVVLDGFMDDVRTGAHGSSGSVHTQATKISRKQIKEVIVHDEKIYEKLVEVVNAINAVEHAYGSGEGDASANVAAVEQLLTNTRGRFQQRTTFLGGL